MHKGIILLVKSSGKIDALSQVKEFMERYKNDVWDWYQIGGRWNNTLAPKRKEWEKKKEKILNPDNDKKFISMKDVEENQHLLEAEWKNLGMAGKNPYCDHYKLPDEGNEYDVMPLSECISIVKGWIRDTKKVATEYYRKMQKERAQENKTGKGTSSAYYAKLYHDAIYNLFCFDSNVYDISCDEGERIPEDIENYYAVMVDIHN